MHANKGVSEFMTHPVGAGRLTQNRRELMLVLMGRSAEADTSWGRVKGLVIRRSGWRSEVCRVFSYIP